MKFAYSLIISIFALLLLFQFLPNGGNSDDIMDNFLDTESFRNSKIPLKTKNDIITVRDKEKEKANSKTNSGGRMVLTFPIDDMFNGEHAKIRESSIVGSFEEGLRESPHTGVDLATYSKNLNARAAAEGTVTVVARKDGQGGNCGVHITAINKEFNLRFSYCHMVSGSIPDDIKVGSKVESGQFIGKVGTTGHSSGIHLHVGITVLGVNVPFESKVKNNAILDMFDDKYFVFKKQTLPKYIERYPTRTGQKISAE